MAALVGEYRDIVLRHIRAMRTSKNRPSDLVREFASRLRAIRVRARDVVQLHIGVMDVFYQKASLGKIRSLTNDARLVLVELMGNLLDMYRESNVMASSGAGRVK